jgi:histidine triad (HIT) family protein
MTACIFCKIVAGEIPGKIAYSDADVVAFHDLSPQAPVHVLVVPRQHVRTFADLPPDGAAPSASTLMAGVHRAAEHLGLGEADGYRVVVNCGERASQSVFHVHVHVLSGRGFAWPPG